MTEEQSDQQGGGSDRDGTASKWTIKNVPWEARNAAIAAARRDGMDLGPWLGRAILTAIRSDREADRAPAVLPPVGPAAPPRPDLGELERMMAIAERIHAMSGKPLPQDIRGKAHRLLRVGLRALEGPTAAPGGSDR